jgi:hypothetical protein
VELFFYLLDLYFKWGTPIFLLNLAIAYAATKSLPEAIRSEGIRCGLPEHGIENAALWRVAVYALVAWPIGVKNWLQSLFN